MHIGNLFPIYSLLIRKKLGIDMLYKLGVSALLSTMPGSQKFSFLTRIWSPGFNSGSGLAP